MSVHEVSPEVSVGDLSPHPAGDLACTVERLSPAVGARVHGVDCKGVSSDDWASILAAFHAHHLLVFPNQTLSASDHAEFMERFGALDIHPQELSARTTLALEENPKIELMLNKPGNFGPRAAVWHTDVTFRGQPPAVTSLYGLETPVGCADTIWTSNRAVFDACTPSFQQLLRGLNVVHATAFVMKRGGNSYDPTRESDPRKQSLEAQYREPVVHPMVHRHEAGFETLYINPGFVSHIEGWSKTESDALLGYLYAQAMDHRYMYRHRWSRNDLVVWDNRCTMHYGVNDYGEQDQRRMHRTTGYPFVVEASRSSPT